MGDKMMKLSPIRAICYKEWLKTRYVILAIGVVCAFTLLLTFMLTHRMLLMSGVAAVWEAVLQEDFNLVGQVRWLPLVVGVALGVFQFGPEVRQKRLKLTLHLPLSDARLLSVMLIYGYGVQVLMAGVMLLSIWLLLLPYFPHEVIASSVATALPWFVNGMAAYGFVAWVCVEPVGRRRVSYFVVGLFLLGIGYLSALPGAYCHFLWFQLLMAIVLAPALCFSALARFREGATAALLPGRGDGARLPGSRNRYTVRIGRIGYLLLLAGGVFLASTVLPYLYHLAFDKKFSVPFTVYSSVSSTFAMQGGGGEASRYRDDEGNVYTRNEFDSILPTIFYTQLLRDGRLPDSLGGVPINEQLLETTFFVFHHRPAEINRPKIPLYPIMNSESARVKMAAVREAFRWAPRGIEIIQMESNTVDTAKTDAFRRALSDVALPVRITVGNPGARKAYDNGYLIVDADNVLWQLRQQDGQPSLRRLSSPSSAPIQAAWVTEFDERWSLGFVSTQDGRFYYVEAASGECIELPVGGYDPVQRPILIYGNLLDMTTRVITDDSVRYLAVSRGLAPRVLRNFCQVIPRDKSDCIAEYLFPFEMRLSSPHTSYIFPYVERGLGWRSFVLSALLSLVLFFLLRAGTLQGRLIKSAAVLLLGVFALIPLLVWRR